MSEEPKIGTIRHEQKVRDVPGGPSEITDHKTVVWTGTEWVDVREARRPLERPMTELSTAEAAVVQRFDAAADAEESLRMRVARAMSDVLWARDKQALIRIGIAQPDRAPGEAAAVLDLLPFADVAIAVLRGTA